MQNMEKVIDKIPGHKYYSKMDCSKGFWQIYLTDSSKPLTALETPQGLFHFKTMPFRFVNAGLCFRRLIRKVVHGVQNVDGFVDYVDFH